MEGIQENDYPEWLTQKEAAAILEVSTQRVRELAHKLKRIDYYREGRTPMYSRQDVFAERLNLSRRPRGGRPSTRPADIDELAKLQERVERLELAFRNARARSFTYFQAYSISQRLPELERKLEKVERALQQKLETLWTEYRSR